MIWVLQIFIYVYDSAIAWFEFVFIKLSAVWHLFEMNS
jgi:hypothetical protein